MAYNENLADRVREILADQQHLEEKKMMGGLAFMVNGKMCLGIIKEDLMARIDPNVYGWALEQYGCRAMDFTGKPMKGYVFIGPEGLTRHADLKQWVALALEYNKLAKASKKKR